MPPTMNQRLTPVKGRMIKSHESRVFDKAISIYMIRLGSGLFEYRRLAKQWIDTGFCIKVEYSFNWPKEKLISKDGFPKKIDTSNRLKESEDAVSEIIGIDDKYFIESNIIKIPKNQSYSDFSVKIMPTKWNLPEDNNLLPSSSLPL